jgi:hypothetical protein
MPPQTIISVPVQTTVWKMGSGEGAFGRMGNGSQLFVVGLYRPPTVAGWVSSALRPPHTSISDPVQTAAAPPRGDGTLAPVEVGIQLSVNGLYRPPDCA